jgi:hypothetical protein
MLRVGFRAAVVSCAAAAGFCVVPAISSAKTIQSTFNKNLQGWTVIGDPATGSPSWVATGGNPGGYLSAVDGGQGVDMLAVAPKSFRGKKGAFYGGTLRFDRQIDNTSGGSYFAPPEDVLLIGDGGTEVHFTLATPPGASWTRQQITLLPQDTSDGTSAATLQAVLSNLTAVQIEIEYIGGGETDDLDNVVLTSPTAPKITSGTTATFTTGVAKTFSIKATGNPAPTLSESGALPSGVGFTDNGDGTGSISGTPAVGTAGTYPITITASNGSGSVTKSVTIKVK